jgi:hypothetical protein
MFFAFAFALCCSDQLSILKEMKGQFDDNGRWRCSSLLGETTFTTDGFRLTIREHALDKIEE